MNSSDQLANGDTEVGKLILPTPTTDDQRETWLQLRRTGIGSSEIAAVMGAGYKTPLHLWLTKTGREPEFRGNDKTRWGAVQESLICDNYAQQTGKVLRESGLWRSTIHEWILATPDREVEFPDDELVEAKNVGMRVAHHWDNGVPPYVLMQTLWQIIATGRKRVNVVASIGGTPPESWLVERSQHEDLIDRMITAADRFWWHVQTDTPPPVTTDTAADIAKAHPVEAGKRIELDFHAEILRQEYLEARDDETAAKARKDAAGIKIRTFMGTAHKGLLGDVEAFTLTQPKPKKKFNESLFAEKNPDEYKKYLEEPAPAAPRLNVK